MRHLVNLAKTWAPKSPESGRAGEGVWNSEEQVETLETGCPPVLGQSAESALTVTVGEGTHSDQRHQLKQNSS